jgi:hypothetical protein
MQQAQTKTQNSDGRQHGVVVEEEAHCFPLSIVLDWAFFPTFPAWKSSTDPWLRGPDVLDPDLDLDLVTLTLWTTYRRHASPTRRHRRT